MAEALPIHQHDQDPANWAPGWQLLQTNESQRVDDWIKWHSEPQFKTDLQFIVTDENGKETRVPACRTVLSINSVFIRNLPAGDEEIEVKIDRTICTDAITVVYFLWLNYPCFTKKVRSIYSELEYIAASPFDGLVDEVLDETIGYDERQMAELCLAIAKIAKLADFMCAAGTIERLVDIFEKIFFLVPDGKKTKYLYMASFALDDVDSRDRRTTGVRPGSSFVEEFPACFLSMNEAEQERIAGHVVPMFDAFLKGCPRQLPRNTHTGHYDTHVNIPDNVRRPAERSLSRLADITTFLLDFYEKARSGPA